MNGTETLGKTLNQAAHHRRIIVDENVRTERNGACVMECIHKDEKLAILIACRVQQFIVFTGELPIEEKCSGMARSSGVGREPVRQRRSHNCRVSPELDHQEVAGVVPRWRWCDARQATW